MAAGSQLAARLLTAAVPHIPQHGFTAAAVVAGAHASEVETKRPLQDEQSLRGLFPGGQTSSSAIPIRLFRTWDEQKLQILAQLKPPSVEQPSSYEPKEIALSLLEERLKASHEVRGHLLEVMALVSAQPLPPVLPAPLKDLALALRLPDSIPNPLPLLVRATRVADEVCQVGGLNAAFGPSWYTQRTRYAAAYLAAELHLASPTGAHDYSASVSVLRSLASSESNPISLLSNDVLKGRKDGLEWVEWGGRAWRGIFRSWGWA